MNPEERLEAFEKMLCAVQESCRAADEKMRQLRSQRKEKSATYRQLMGSKLQYQRMLSLYQVYGLLEPGEEKAETAAE